MSDKEKHKKKDRNNIFKLVVSQFLINLGDVLINPKVTLPWIMQVVGAPLYLLGWLVPIRESGSLLPQIVIAHFMYRLKVRKWVWVLGSVIQSISVLAMGVCAFFFDGAIAGWGILGGLIIFSIARGLNSVASKDVLGKTVDKAKRGRVTGWSSSASGLITVCVAVSILLYFKDIEGGASYYIGGIAVATLVWLLAAWIYSSINEPQSDIDPKNTKLLDLFKELGLLRKDKVFREFVIARSLFLCAALSAPFYVVIAQQKSENNTSILGLFILASGLASLFSSPFWGLFSDYSSRKVMIVSSLLSVFTGVFLFLCVRLFPETDFITWLIAILYFVLNIAHQGVRIGRKTYLVNLGEGNKRTSYVSVSNTIIGIVLLAMSSLSLLTYFLSLESLVLVFSIVTLFGVIVAVRLPEA
ncbi:MFS transporter [Marinomonas sp. CT5]|uniref:MFS transporter n=1 Tax=Marinomonas sp. CT5 TaxID=2066133 RepID=UPI001BAFB4BB|nr:MFS transporter [Marinomonas sp. CT5]QUX94722.1 MFS transporter [Marinomonas sp. CT5]